MLTQMINLEYIETYLNTIVVIIFFIGIIASLYLFKIKQTASNFFLVLLNVGGFLLSFGVKGRGKCNRHRSFVYSPEVCPSVAG